MRGALSEREGPLRYPIAGDLFRLLRPYGHATRKEQSATKAKGEFTTIENVRCFRVGA